MKGLKYDDGKRDWSLLPWEAVEEIVRVLEFGAKKYKRESWKEVVPKERYDRAALRHRIAYQQGETFDQESGVHHLAHEAVNCIFKIWEDLHNENKPTADR